MSTSSINRSPASNTPIHVPKEKSKSRSLFPTIRELHTLLHQDLTESDLDLYKERVVHLRAAAQKKIAYYDSKKFGFIIRFFSSIRTFKNFGVFKSVGYYAKDLATTTETLITDLENQIVKNKATQAPELITKEPNQTKFFQAKADLDEQTADFSCCEDSSTSENEWDDKDEFYDASSNLAEFDLLEYNAAEVKEPAPSPPDEMLDAFESIWKRIGPEDKQIRSMWAQIMLKADVLDWHKTGKSDNQYTLTLKEKITGKPTTIKANVQIEIPAQLQIQFSEDDQKKIISFNGKKQISITWGYITIYLRSITVEENIISFFAGNKCLNRSLQLKISKAMKLCPTIEWA